MPARQKKHQMRERRLPCALCKTSSTTHNDSHTLARTHARRNARTHNVINAFPLLSQAQPAMIIMTSIRENIFTRDKSSERKTQRERENTTRDVGAAAVREMKLTPRRRHLLQCTTGHSRKEYSPKKYHKHVY